jgi:hypothetical protein
MGNVAPHFTGDMNLHVLFRWLRTGDEVIVNDDAEIFIVDRLKVGMLFIVVSAACTT